MNKNYLLITKFSTRISTTRVWNSEENEIFIEIRAQENVFHTFFNISKEWPLMTLQCKPPVATGGHRCKHFRAVNSVSSGDNRIRNFLKELFRHACQHDFVSNPFVCHPKAGYATSVVHWRKFGGASVTTRGLRLVTNRSLK